jgi:hypothetical protein
MNREHFDALAKLVWGKSSRRRALGTILGGALLGHAPVPVGAKRKSTNKRNRRRKKKRDCYPGTSCHLGPGRDNAGCDWEGATAFFEGDFHGADLSGANLTGAQMAGANLHGADLGGACLVGANLLAADLGGADLDGAIFCHTLMPDGSFNDSGCGQGTRCCPTPGPICRTCAGSDCIQSFNTPCSIFGTPCCPGMACTSTAALGFTTCQAPCDTDQDCVSQFGPGIKCCAGQSLVCPFFPGARCCAVPGPLTC